MNRLRAAWHQASLLGPIVIAALMLAASALISSVTNIIDERNEHRNDETHRALIDRLEFEIECRSDIAAPVQEAQAEKLDALALGLVAAAKDDPDALEAQVRRIVAASAAEQDALDARRAAVETCNRRADARFD